MKAQNGRSQREHSTDPGHWPTELSDPGPPRMWDRRSGLVRSWGTDPSNGDRKLQCRILLLKP